jgi:hypothetical protein
VSTSADSVSFTDPHVTIVGTRTDGLNGVRWPFGYWDWYDSWNPTEGRSTPECVRRHVHPSSGLPVRPSTQIGAAAPAQGSALR